MGDNTENRYLRQVHAFPEDRRRASAMAVFGAEANPVAGTAILAGAAAMGVPVVGSDFHGPFRPGHWLLGEFPEMVGRINTEVSYEYLDPDIPGVDMRRLAEGHPNAWAVVLLNDLDCARSVLDALATASVNVRVLMGLVGPGGLVVDRQPDPASALECLRCVSGSRSPPGSAELAIAAGGLILNEVMLGGGSQDGLAASGTIGAYGLHRQRRMMSGNAPLADLLAEVVAGPDGPVASFAGRRLLMVGAGALANWSLIPLAMEGPEHLAIYDGDPEVAVHNINRQVLLVNGVGQGRPKVEVLVEEIRRLDPHGTYDGIFRFVKTPGDLAGLESADALVCVPDNDEARLVCDEARRRADVLFATAGSSAVGGQTIVRSRRQGCLRCLGLGESSAGALDGSQSCSLVQNDAVVSSNMVAVGLMISELREALAGRSPTNLRFAGDSIRGNRLVRMISGSRCPHIVVTSPLAR